MKKLSELLPNFPLANDVLIKGIKTNSNEIQEGDLFVCIKGVKVDRHDFIPDAINKGAVALITSKDVDADIPYIKVDSPEELIDTLYRNFYDNPQNRLKLIGVTGTDGKTSTATIIQTLIGNDKCGYIGTNGYACNQFNRPTANTTPSKDKLYQYLNEFCDAGMKYVAMEASSEAFYYHRLDNLTFQGAAISNITSEHLNTHKTLENYIECKKQLFKQLNKDAYAILNIDDKHFEEVKNVTNKYLTYGRNPIADLWIKNEELLPNHSLITLVYQNEEYHIDSPLLGSFNIENLCEAILTVLSLGFNMRDIIQKIPNCKISGRMESITLGQAFYCLVDYAHTPNGISRLLSFTKSLDVNRRIVVIGQAGERDPYKRHEVGKIVAENCDIAIFTYEDPRNEDLDQIMEMITSDIKNRDNYLIIKDRKAAIQHAIDIAKTNDMVMILGKGNETYQKIKNEVIYFNDIEEATEAINNVLTKNKN